MIPKNLITVAVFFVTNYLNNWFFRIGGWCKIFIKSRSSLGWMNRKKVYGQSQDVTCYFCGKQAYTKNKQGVPTCMTHKTSEIEAKRCLCGEFLDIKQSKYGFFFLCPVCGPKSPSKVDDFSQSGFKLNKKFRR